MLLLIRQTAPLDTYRLRQLLAGDLLKDIHRLTRAVPLSRLARYGGRGEHVESAHGTGARRVGCRAQRRDGDHGAVLAPHEEETQIRLVRTV